MSPVASNWISSFQPSCAGPPSGPYTKNWSPDDNLLSRALSEKCTGNWLPSSFETLPAQLDSASSSPL